MRILSPRVSSWSFCRRRRASRKSIFVGPSDLSFLSYHVTSRNDCFSDSQSRPCLHCVYLANRGLYTKRLRRISQADLAELKCPQPDRTIQRLQEPRPSPFPLTSKHQCRKSKTSIVWRRLSPSLLFYLLFAFPFTASSRCFPPC